MAKCNHTTSTSRRATAAKATKAAAEVFYRLEDEGFAEVSHLRHLARLWRPGTTKSAAPARADPERCAKVTRVTLAKPLKDLTACCHFLL